MSVTTSSPINMDTLLAALPAGVTSVEVAGSPIDSAGAKQLTVDGGVTDAALQTAITAAAAQFVDRTANQATLRQQAQSALTRNRTYAASSPTAAQVAAESKAHAQQLNGIIRLLLNQLDATN